jgi:N-methylhydantoinase A/oxoprolinase/acetone carboxylase beta subunit
VTRNGGHSVPAPVAESSLKNSQDLKAALTGGRSPAGGEPVADVLLELVRLRVNKAMPAPRIAERPMEGPDSSHAKTGTRAVGWGSADGVAQIYSWESLKPGNRIAGCAVIEGINSTQFIPQSWVMVMDRFGNGTVSRNSKK